MKIAHVTPTFPPYYAGTGNVALQNARALAKLGHDVTVYTARMPGSPGFELDGRVEVHRLPAAVRIGLAPLLPGLFLLPRYDLLHLHYPFIFGAETVWTLKRLRGQPYVLTYHNDLLAPGIKGALFAAYERAWTGRLLREARKVVVTNRDGALSSPLLGPLLRSDPDRIVEIPNGIDTSHFRPLAPEGSIRQELGLRVDGLVILFVGAMDNAHHPKGGVSILLEAVRRLGRRDVTVLLVGGGDRVAEYSALATSLGLSGLVDFAGPIAPERMPEVYAVSDVVVQPSQLFEPFGLVAAEAMACGKPVVVSDLPGVRRVVTDAAGGLLARPGDPDDLAARIERLLSDASLRSELGSRGRSGVEARYDSRRIGPMLEDAYTQALGSTN